MRRFAAELKGFTLIEIIVAVLILSIAAVAVVPMFGQVSRSLTINRDVQVATQLAQECSEYLLSARREFGYAMNGLSDCSALSAFGGFGPPAVAVTNPYAGAACPGGNCKLFQVSAAYASGASVVTLVVTEY